MHKKILILTIAGGLSFFLSNPLWAENQEKLSIEEIAELSKLIKSTPISLPSINEIYNSAIYAKVTSNWDQKIKLQNKNYKGMTAPRRAFEVGKTLSDITFLVVTKAPSNEIKNAAFQSLTSIKLPPKFKSELEKFARSGGNLKGEALRRKMDYLIKVLLNNIQNSKKDATIRDPAMTLLAASYFKAYYLAAETIKDEKNPTKEQLSLFSSEGWRDLTNYFFNYFTNTASKSYQQNKVLKNFSWSLSKIKNIIEKPKESITKEDISSIYEVLKNSFK
jgi:hypothetical protein